MWDYDILLPVWQRVLVPESLSVSDSRLWLAVTKSAMWTCSRQDAVTKWRSSRGTAVVAAVACGRPAGWVREAAGGEPVSSSLPNHSASGFWTHAQPCPGPQWAHSGFRLCCLTSPPRLSVYLYWREISRAGIAIELQLTGECNRYSARLFSGSFATNKSPGEVPRRKLERRGCECCRRHDGCFCRLGLSGGQTRRTLTFFYSLSRSLLSASKWST